MADIRMESGLVTERARVVDDPRDNLTPATAEAHKKDELAELTAWVVARTSQWRDHRRQNYDKLWDQYERKWRSIWMPEEMNRKSERSTLITPALGEAVENIVAEVEEALFGRGDFFDMKGELDDSPADADATERNKRALKEDLARVDFVPNIGEALINGAVYGTGIGEILMETYRLREITASVDAAMQDIGMPGLDPAAPAMPAGPHMMPDGTMMGGEMPQDPAMMGQDPAMMGQDPAMMAQDPAMAPQAPALPAPEMPMAAPMMDPMLPPVAPEPTVVVRDVTFACLQSVNPRNFLIDPTARTIDKALGAAVEEYVGAHIIRAGQKAGDFRDVPVGTSAGDRELGSDRQVESEYSTDKVRILRYYGLVPKALLFPPGSTVDLTARTEGEALGKAVRQAETLTDEITQAELEGDSDENSMPSTEPVEADMVEALVFIANDSVCLKAVENPYLMQDRPLVAFPWDVVPGRFWGRGVCEKGLTPQKALDSELRARMDALAFTSAPMMAMDASRLPRGFKFSVRPGRSVLTNGDPSTIMKPFTFGQLDQNTYQHSQQLDQMIQRATGSLDVISLAQRGGDARPGAVSMMLSGIVKRHKRTLMGFVERFFIPALRKIMWRNMQFYPERYDPSNWTFNASSTMGILQREYESQQLVSLLNTIDPQSPEYKVILMGVVANTGLTHRTEIIDMLKQSITTAQQQQAAQAAQASDPQLTQLQTQYAQMELQLKIAETQAKIAELQSRARLQDAKTQNEILEPQFKQLDIATKGIYAMKERRDQEIKSRLAITDRILKEKDIDSNERIAQMQSGASVASQQVKAASNVEAAKAKASASAPQPVPVPVPVPVPAPAPRPRLAPQPFQARGARIVRPRGF